MDATSDWFYTSIQQKRTLGMLNSAFEIRKSLEDLGLGSWELDGGLTIFLCLNKFSIAILISGGKSLDSEKSSEMYVPSMKITCNLPNLPDKRRAHTQDNSQICGGVDDASSSSCIEWNVGLCC